MSTLLLTAMVLAAAPEKWVTVDEPPFSAQFPKAPVKGPLPNDPGTVVHQLLLKLVDGRVLEMVLSVSTPPEDVRSKARELSAEQLRQVQMELLAPEDFTLLSETEVAVEIGGKSVPARDFTARNGEGRKLSGRVLTYKGRLFQLLTFHPVAKPLDAEHARFIASVRLK
jgi:hypothetical protein